MSSPDAQSAASSAAVESTPALPADLASLSPSERAEWRKTGALPDASSTTDAAAASSPAEPVEQAASTDATPQPASEPGASVKDKGKGVEARKKELDAEIDDLKGRLKLRAQLREELAAYNLPGKPDAQPADSSSAPAAALPKFPEFAHWMELTGNPSASYEDYIDARQEFRLRLYEQSKAAEQQARARHSAVAETVTAYKTSIDKVVESDPGFWDKLHPAIANLTPESQLGPQEPVTVQAVLAEQIIQSAVAPQLLLHLSAHPDEYAKLLQSPSRDALTRAIGKLEAKLEAPASAPTVPLPKTVTDAPPPPPTLSTRAHAPADEATQALLAGDFSRYRALMNAQEVGARR